MFVYGSKSSTVAPRYLCEGRLLTLDDSEIACDIGASMVLFLRAMPEYISDINERMMFDLDVTCQIDFYRPELKL